MHPAGQALAAGLGQADYMVVRNHLPPGLLEHLIACVASSGMGSTRGGSHT